MDNTIQSLFKHSHEIHSAVNKLTKALEDDHIYQAWITEISRVAGLFKTLDSTTPNIPTQELLNHFEEIGFESIELAKKLFPYIDSSNDAARSAINELGAKGQKLNALIPAATIAINTIELKQIKSEIASAKSDLTAIATEHSNQIKLTTKAITAAQSELASIEQQLNNLKRIAQNETEKILSHHEETRQHLEDKRKEVDGLVESTATQIIARDYHNSAANEKNSADKFRLAAIAFMLLIVIIVAESTLSTLSSEFDWRQTLTRFTLVFLLSIPTAYFARESAKHREQQYHFHQTSLDTRAISPFISSLPNEEQHKIKAAVAAKLFAGRDLSKFGTDSFPLNTQDILIELIKKLEIPGKNPRQ